MPRNYTEVLQACVFMTQAPGHGTDRHDDSSSATTAADRKTAARCCVSGLDDVAQQAWLDRVERAVERLIEQPDCVALEHGDGLGDGPSSCALGTRSPNRGSVGRGRRLAFLDPTAAGKSPPRLGISEVYCASREHPAPTYT
jgi:hypothetical protein